MEANHRTDGPPEGPGKLGRGPGWVAMTVGVLLAAELALRLVPVADPYARFKQRAPASPFIRSAFPPGLSISTNVEPGLPGMRGPNRFSTNAAGFRGPELVDPKPVDEVRIFLVGGSTTEGFYLDDGQALHSTLAASLQACYPDRRIRVYNAGKSGDRSDDHVAMVVHRIIHAEPDVVVVFAGINDLLAGIMGYDFRHPAPSVAPPRFGLTHQVRFLVTEFQLPRRLYYLAKRLRPRDEEDALQEIPLTSQYASVVALRQAAPELDSMPPVDTASYERSLRTLAGAVQANRASIAFMTQQTTWAGGDSVAAAWHWMRLRDGRAWRADSLDVALEALNRAMRRVAKDVGAPLIDLVALLPKSSRYFYDDVHFNVEGARVAGQAIGAALVGAGLLEPPDRFKSTDRARSLPEQRGNHAPVARAAPDCAGRPASPDSKE